MKIKFCGAARNVTGSSHLITLDDGYNILLDCGLFQGSGRNVWDWNNQWHFTPQDIDCVILSHAHIDHCGRLPQLVKDGFSGHIHSTHATRSLCGIMLLDSAYIQERDVEYHNRRNKKHERSSSFRRPLYTSENVGPTMDLFRSYSYDKWIKIDDRISFMFKDTGHILGSASITIKINENGKETRIGFTGDIGRPNRPILRDPQWMPEVDYLICESTYGNRDHEDAPAQSEKLLNIIKKAIDLKSKLIIPAFSIGRTQEIVYMLDKMETAGLLPKIPVFVDSPLAVNATMIFGAHPECFDNQLNEYLLVDDDPFGFNSLKYIKKVEDSKALNAKEGPFIIISAAGMMNAGRVKHHLFNNIDKENAIFLMVGYASPETPAGMLKNGISEIKLFGEVKPVRAQIEEMNSFSAHGDRNEMKNFISNQKDLKMLFLVHGDYDAQQSFKEFLHAEGHENIMIPDKGQKYELQD